MNKSIKLGSYVIVNNTSHIYVVTKIEKYKSALYYDIESLTKKEKVNDISALGFGQHESLQPHSIKGIHENDLLDQCQILSSQETLKMINLLFS